MPLEILSMQSANSLLDLFNSLTNTVFWIRSPDYQRQLYVSSAYEAVWGRTCQSLYEYPESWNDTLLPEDKDGKIFTFNERKQQDYSGLVLFRIFQPNGKTLYIQDQSFLLSDKDQRPVAVVGVGESITPDTWHSLIDGFDGAIPTKREIPDFLKLLTQTYQLHVPKQQLTPLPTAPTEKTYTFQFEQKQIKVSRREWQTLEFLLQGYSAKQTAWMLNISIRTVEVYLDKLRKKTGCRSKLALVSKVQLINQ